MRMMLFALSIQLAALLARCAESSANEAMLPRFRRQQALALSRFVFNTTGFACSGCLAGGAGGPVQIRAMFFEKQGIVHNEAAQRKASLRGVEHDCASTPKAQPECFIAANWDKGWVGELFYDIAKETGGQVVAMTQANFSSSSAHLSADVLTRCAWETMQGLVDVCVADAWETDERRTLASFTSPMDVDVFTLVTKAHDVEFSQEHLLNFSKPFEWQLWLVVVFAVLLGGLLLDLVDDSSPYTRWTGVSNRSRALAVLLWPARRLVLLGFGVLAIMLVSLYVAWLSRFIMHAAPDLRPALISSLADAIESGRPVCMLRSAVGLIQKPGMKVDAVDTVWQSLEYVQSGRCIGAVIGKDDYLTYVSAQSARYNRCPAGQTDICLDNVSLGECLCSSPGKDPEDCPSECPHYHKFCNLFRVSDPEFSSAITVGLPVRPWLQDVLSAWIVKKRLQGDIEKLRRLYLEDANPPVCDWEKQRAGAVPVSLQSSAGVFVLCGSLMFLGFFWHHIVVCLCPIQDPGDEIAVGSVIYTKRGLVSNVPVGTRAVTGPSATEFRLDALSLVDNMRNGLEQTATRNEDRLIRQEERIVRQDRKLDDVRKLLGDLNGKLGKEMEEETQNYATMLSAANARLKVAEEDVVIKHRELELLQQRDVEPLKETINRLRQHNEEMVQEREMDVAKLQLQLQDVAAEMVNMKQSLGERVGEVFELRQLLAERDGEIHQLRESRVGYTEELMHAKGQIGEKDGRLEEMQQKAEDYFEETRKLQAILLEKESELMHLRKQMDVTIEVHREREKEYVERVGNSKSEAHELRYQTEEKFVELMRLRESAGERAGEMFELRQALHERTEEIIDLKGELGERSWEILDLKQQLGERASEVLASSGKLQESAKQLDESKAKCNEWRWQAEELRKELEEKTSAIDRLTTENANLFGDNANLRQDLKALEESAARQENDTCQQAQEHMSMLTNAQLQQAALKTELDKQKLAYEADIAERTANFEAERNSFQIQLAELQVACTDELEKQKLAHEANIAECTERFEAEHTSFERQLTEQQAIFEAQLASKTEDHATKLRAVEEEAATKVKAVEEEAATKVKAVEEAERKLRQKLDSRLKEQEVEAEARLSDTTEALTAKLMEQKREMEMALKEAQTTADSRVEEEKAAAKRAISEMEMALKETRATADSRVEEEKAVAQRTISEMEAALKEAQATANSKVADEKAAAKRAISDIKEAVSMTISKQDTEICELKTLVGQHVNEVMEVRGLLRDRCRDISELETKVKEKEEMIENLKTETAMRAMEAEEQRNQMSVLWDLGSKMQVLLELDLGTRLQSMAHILEKVDCVLDKEDIITNATQRNGHGTKLQFNHLSSNLPPAPMATTGERDRAPDNTSKPMQWYETSTTFAPGTLANAPDSQSSPRAGDGEQKVSHDKDEPHVPPTQGLERSMPVPPIAFKPPRSIEEWNQLAHQMTPRSASHSETQSVKSASAALWGDGHGQTGILGTPHVLTPRSVQSSVQLGGRSFFQPGTGHGLKITGHEGAVERASSAGVQVGGETRVPSSHSHRSQSAESTYY